MRYRTHYKLLWSLPPIGGAMMLIGGVLFAKKAMRSDDYSLKNRFSFSGTAFSQNTQSGADMSITLPASLEIKKADQEKVDPADISYLDARLTLIRKIILKGVDRPGTLIILHPPKSGLTTVDFLLRVINWLANNARKQPNFYLPEAKFFPTMIRDIILEKKENGKLISPNKIGSNWIGGIQIAVEEDIKNDKAFYKKMDIITGHMPMGLHDYQPGAEFNEPVRYAIVINEPYQRLLSLINFDFQRGFLEGLTKEQQYDYWLNLNIDNLQTRMAAGVKYMSGECTEETLQVAKANLEKFLLVGISEDIEGFVQVLATIYAIGPLAISKQQVTGKKLFQDNKEIPKELEEQIKARNTYDTKLYHWAKKNWHQFKLNHVCKAENIPDQKYLAVFADSNGKNWAPAYMSAKFVEAYNAAIMAEYKTMPVNAREFSSRKFFFQTELPNVFTLGKPIPEHSPTTLKA